MITQADLDALLPGVSAIPADEVAHGLEVASDLDARAYPRASRLRLARCYVALHELACTGVLARHGLEDPGEAGEATGRSGAGEGRSWSTTTREPTDADWARSRWGRSYLAIARSARAIGGALLVRRKR